MDESRYEYLPLVLIVFIAIASFMFFSLVVGMVVLGASLAVVLVPLHNHLSQRTGPWISAVLITILIVCISTGGLLFTFFILGENTGTLNQIVDTIGTWLANPATDPSKFGIPFSREQLLSALSVVKVLFVDYRNTFTNDIGLITFASLALLLSLGILLIWGRNLKAWVMEYIPVRIRRHEKRFSDVTVDMLYALYIVQLAIAALTFFIAIPVFYLLGYGDVLFYSFLTAFCEFIPVLGSSVAFIVVGAYALARDDIRGVLILFFLGYIGVSALPEIFMRPVLMGRRVHVHPVIMFVGFIGGIIAFGLAGFVLGPVILVWLMTGYRIYKEEHRKTKELVMEELT